MSRKRYMGGYWKFKLLYLYVSGKLYLSAFSESPTISKLQ